MTLRVLLYWPVFLSELRGAAAAAATPAGRIYSRSWRCCETPSVRSISLSVVAPPQKKPVSLPSPLRYFATVCRLCGPSLSFPSPSSNNITKSRPAFYSRDSPLNSFLLRSRVLICLCVCVLDSNRRVRIRSTSAASSASVPAVPLSVCVCVPVFSLSIHFLSLSRERTESSQRCCDGRRLTGGLLLTDKRKKHLDHRERETPTLPSFFF